MHYRARKEKWRKRVVALMMKIAYPICCGADIHKNSIVATIVTTDKCGISQYQQKTFSTINSDILRFHDWLIEHHCMFVWNPQESNGFLFLITSNMTSMYALPISSMLRPSKAKRLFPMQVLPMFCPTPLAKQQPKS